MHLEMLFGLNVLKIDLPLKRVKATSMDKGKYKVLPWNGNIILTKLSPLYASSTAVSDGNFLKIILLFQKWIFENKINGKTIVGVYLQK